MLIDKHLIDSVPSKFLTELIITLTCCLYMVCRYCRYYIIIIASSGLLLYNWAEAALYEGAYTTAQQSQEEQLQTAIRLDIKRFIDELSGLNTMELVHTTDSLEESRQDKLKRLPDKPQPFEAGRFKVTFGDNKVQYAIICQTEEKVGHIATVIPGVTRIQGHIQLLDDPKVDYGAGPILNVAELDYFLQTIYRKFRKPLSLDEARLLNRLKDIALAIRFDSPTDLQQYHAQQVSRNR